MPAYPRPTQTFTVGDVRDIRYVRYRDRDKNQLDPTGLTAAVSMQRVNESGERTGDPVAAITVTVVDDPKQAGAKAWLLRIDASGVTAGRYEWQLTVSGTDPDGRALDVAPAGGIIELEARVPAVS